MVQIINREIMKNGVDLILKDSVQAIGSDEVTLASGRTVKAQAVVMAIGVTPENALAKQAGSGLGCRRLHQSEPSLSNKQSTYLCRWGCNRNDLASLRGKKRN
jgi:NADH dehydrogenase FAD-containing subunit